MKRALSIILAIFIASFALAQEQKNIIVRFTSEDSEAISAAVDAFEKVGILFTMERTILRNDTPEMKEALTKVQWKNNELTSRIGLIPGVSVVDAEPGNVASIIAKAKAEKWNVNVPRPSSLWVRKDLH